MDGAQKAYNRLFRLSREAATLGSVGALLHWDQETHMPPDAARARAGQCELIASLIHKRHTSKSFENALKALVDLDTGAILQEGLTDAQQAAVREWRRDFRHATCLPPSWVKRFAKATSEAVEVWRQARAKSKFSLFAPHLKRIRELWLQKSELLGYEEHPYDAHLDEYEPGATTAQIKAIFDGLRRPLTQLRSRLLERPQPDTAFLSQPYDKDVQLAVAKQLVTATGYTDQRGTFDLTTHPFCSCPHPTDGRITTRISEHDPMENILATMHEGGHYLYEVNLPEEAWGSPLGQACSMAVHESQSRWWECLVGQSHPFWQYALPILKKAFPKQLGSIELEPFVKGVNALRPTPIRIEADEISYCLHVILRFDLERRLIEGALEVDDVPEAWNTGMQDLLGMTPQDDAHGCLQDVHWAFGHFGYFPTYALGNLYAAQLFEPFATEHPDWKTRVAAGDFAFMRQWLNTHVHQYGRQYQPHDLIRRVTGTDLSPTPYLTYLTDKYNALYG